MKLSVITVCYNSQSTVEDTILSVLSQTYKNVEYIVIDGNSKDATLDIINKHKLSIQHIISEPDQGMWDAMNKGLKIATGDYVGFLNSDDVFASTETLEHIAKIIENNHAGAVFGFVDIVTAQDLSRVVRRYRVKTLSRAALRMGMMPAHPGFFCDRSFFEQYGGFSLDAAVAPDFELMIRFVMKGALRGVLLPETIVKMRDQGLSNTDFKYRLGRFLRQARSCRINGLWSHPFLILLKYPYKLLEYIK